MCALEFSIFQQNTFTDSFGRCMKDLAANKAVYHSMPVSGSSYTPVVIHAVFCGYIFVGIQWTTPLILDNRFIYTISLISRPHLRVCGCSLLAPPPLPPPPRSQ